MFKPYLNSVSSNDTLLSSFGGYDSREIIEENCFSFQENMSSDKFPVLSPRNKRAFFNVSGGGIKGIFAKSELCYINNGFLYYGGEKVEGLAFQGGAERSFVSMGSRLLIFPDKVYVNTADFTDYGYLENSFASENGTNVTVTLSKIDGSSFGETVISSSEPSEKVNGILWLDTAVTPNALKQYSESTGIWFGVEDTCLKITCPNIGRGFSADDGVSISGFDSDELNGSFIIRNCGDDYIIVSGILSSAFTQSTPVRVERLLPNMDFVCENGNRLWGCSSENNEIYASKLGDPKNFNCFMGIASDSYAVSLGTDGEFTGACSFRGYTLFFKENCVHKAYGSNPPYTVSTAFLKGVQKGSEKSLVTLGGALYYKSPTGICVFEGGLPIDISAPLGGEYYHGAVGGCLGDKYYISLLDKNDNSHLFSYNSAKGIWSREDGLKVHSFCSYNSNLFCIGIVQGEKRLMLIDGENMYGNFTGTLAGFYPEESVEWVAESGLWGLSVPENKYYSGITMRIFGEKGSVLSVDFQKNCDGKWENQKTVKLSETGSFTLPFISPRCDTLKIRLRGKGRVKVFTVGRKMQLGSELNV